jgi:hypothetical protein
MSSLIRLLILITSAASVVTAQDQRWTQSPKCIDSDTKYISTSKQCYNTVSLAIELVDSAEGDFDEAYNEAEDEEGSEDSDIDYRFLRYLIKGKFNNQGVFYSDTATTLSDLSRAVTALEIADRSPTSPSLRNICPQLNLDLYRRFQLQPKSLYDVACGGIYIPTPSSSTSCSTVSTASTLSSISSSATSSSSNSFTTPPPLAATSSRSSSSTTTSCTTTAIIKRQEDSVNELDYFIKEVASALFAISLIINNQDDFECQADDYWVDSYNLLALFGGYIQDLM